MRNGWFEIEIGRALGRAFPWMARVKRLPGGGILTQCGLWHAGPANDATIS